MDKHARLRWSRRLEVLFLCTFAVLAVFSCMGSVLCLVGMFLLVIPALAVEFAMNRCPHCDGWLAKNRGNFCRHCGQRIRENRPDT